MSKLGSSSYESIRWPVIILLNELLLGTILNIWCYYPVGDSILLTSVVHWDACLKGENWLHEQPCDTPDEERLKFTDPWVRNCRIFTKTKYSILPITRTSKGSMKMVRVNECSSYPG